MEAMWINFESPEGKRFAVRPYVGGVNGISGEASLGNMTSMLRRMNSQARKQDYIILPKQPWLDGIATAPGIVRQFVATAMAPPRPEKPREDKSFSRAKRGATGLEYYPQQESITAAEDTPLGSSIE
jgi:hypothetical protein